MARMRKVKPGDGHPLARLSLVAAVLALPLHLYLSGVDGAPETWSIDVRHGGDSDGEVRAQLYRDGVNQATSKLPASFVVPGGVIEVGVSAFGLKRGHYVTYDGSERQLMPDPASAEGRRARLDRSNPALSRTLGLVSVTVLAVSLVLGVPQIIEQVTQLRPIAESIGTFYSPVRLPAWVNISLVLAALIASTERALRLRYNPVLDGGLFDGDD